MAFSAVPRGRWPPFFAGLLLGAALVGRINRPLPVTTPTSAASPSPTVGAVLGSQNTDHDTPRSPTVTRVIDGDTVELDDGRKVRYLGIDAPEISKHDCFAREAKAANVRLVLNHRVRLERDVTDSDRYDRLLRYVYVGETMVNLQMVADGFATALAYPPDVRHLDQIRAAMAAAKAARRGLWAGCSTPSQPNATDTLNSYDRRNLRYETTESVGSIDGCAIKGNISAKGEKIYHLPGCGSYEKTTIDESRGEQWFCTEAEAQAAGWRKARNCP